MTTHEITEHLEHLLKYVRYSEDAPALREAIEMLKCSEIPNSSDERTDKRTGTHACDCVSRQAAIDALYHVDEYNGRSIEAIRNLPSAQLAQQLDQKLAQPNLPDTNVGDLISRLSDLRSQYNCFDESERDAYGTLSEAIKVPSAQPEIVRCKDCRHNHNCDIQYHAQAGDMFFCAGAERRTDECTD